MSFSVGASPYTSAANAEQTYQFPVTFARKSVPPAYSELKSFATRTLPQGRLANSLYHTLTELTY